jgi:hypothetical protein
MPQLPRRNFLAGAATSLVSASSLFGQPVANDPERSAAQLIKPQTQAAIDLLARCPYSFLSSATGLLAREF